MKKREVTLNFGLETKSIKPDHFDLRRCKQSKYVMNDVKA